jgi:hypothetical protein
MFWYILPGTNLATLPRGSSIATERLKNSFKMFVKLNKTFLGHKLKCPRLTCDGGSLLLIASGSVGTATQPKNNHLFF